MSITSSGIIGSISPIGAAPIVTPVAASIAANSAATSSASGAGQNLPGSSWQDAYVSDASKLFAAVQNGDMAAAQRLLPSLQASTWPLYEPAQIAQSPQSALQAVQNDLQTFVAAITSGNATVAQQALAALSADLAAEKRGSMVPGAQPVTSSASTNTR